MRLLFLILARLSILSLFPCFVLAQTSSDNMNTNTIEAIILDKESLEPIAYATVFNINTKAGTVSNIKGFFRLNQLSLNDSLSISFIGYSVLKIMVADVIAVNKIYLEPRTEMLNEFVVTADNSHLYNLLLRCRKSVTNETKTAKTYFELETQIDTNQVELIECYYNGNYVGYDISELKLKNGRISLIGIDSKYFLSTETSKALNMHKVFESNDYFPKSPFEFGKKKLEKAYDLSLSSKYRDEQGNTIYVLNFIPKNNPKSFFEGEVWIDSLSAKILKINFKIINASVYPFLSIRNSDKLKQVDIEMSKSFKEIDGKSYVNSIDFNYKLKYKVGNDSLYNVSTNSILYAYDYKDEFDLPFFLFSEGSYSDYRNIMAVPNNVFFWNNMDEFKLNDRKNKHKLFKKKSFDITNQSTILGNMKIKRGLFEQPYVTWSRGRIRFRENPQDNAQNKSFEDAIPSTRYNLNVQLYVDVNKIADSLNVITETIFDPFESFFHYPMDKLGMTFINLFFDLMEVKRREFEDEIHQENMTIELIKRIYTKKMKNIEEVSSNFFKEVERGNNEKAMIKWNEYIKGELNIDNIEIFRTYEQLR